MELPPATEEARLHTSNILDYAVQNNVVECKRNQLRYETTPNHLSIHQSIVTLAPSKH